MEDALPGNGFCPVKVRTRGMFKCKKKWMQSSASVKDSVLVEIASQLYADVWLAHDLSHDRIHNLRGRLQSTLPMQYPDKKGFFAIKGDNNYKNLCKYFFYLRAALKAC